VAALDGERQVAQGAALDGDDIEIDAQGLAEHSFGAVDTLGGIDAEAHRGGVQQHPAAGIAAGERTGHRLVHVLGPHRLAAGLGATEEALAERAAARDVDEHLGDGLAGHALGLVDRHPDGALRLVEVDHDAALDAAGRLVAHAENLDARLDLLAGLGAPAGNHLADHAAGLGGADIERGDDLRTLVRLLGRTLAARQGYNGHWSMMS
jgi:hypothetical protein